MQAMTQSELTAADNLPAEPARTQMPPAPLRELLMEAGFVGAVVLALVLIVVSSVGP